MTLRIKTADRYCLTCKGTSASKDFRGPKCGPCVKRFGMPRTSTFNAGGSLGHKATPNKNIGYVK